jgi:hypothetical protein
VIGRELADRILEGHKRVVAADDASGLGADRVQLAEHSLKPLIGLLARFIRGRRKPLEAFRQGGRDDQNLLGRVEERANPERKVLRGGSRLAHGYQ